MGSYYFFRVGVRKFSSMQDLLVLIKKPVWTYKDIMLFDSNIKSATTAERIKKRAIKEYNGAVKFGTQYVKTDSVLALYGTSRENEMKLFRKEESI